MSVTGKFKDALENFTSGIDIDSASTSAHCRESAAKIGQIMQVMEKGSCRISRNEFNAVITIEGSIVASQTFDFAGNLGNTGNIPSGFVNVPGGRNYDSLDGPRVIIKS